ncbi:MAG: branched-chain amino acid aminotransferase [Chloroflexi bacterium]|nr:branched-chain amino acid aminotransferase [Chloroflexota bacterium]|tara:strand:+ start:278 stop:1180 length:903 start_codon:yes stop_codon:yes gene_type:complete
MTSERVAYVNGEIVPESQALISIHDRGFLQGYSVFDTTRTFKHKIFKLDEHLNRFYNSLKYARLDPGMDISQMAQITMQVLETNLPLIGDDDDYWVTQRVSRGISGPEGDKPTIIVESVPLPFAARAKYYKDGMPVVIPSVRRTPPEVLSPRAKIQNYANLVQAEFEVKDKNPDGWPILLDMNGNLCEGPGSNFFIVKNGAVVTPREQFVLAGISRATTIELAQELGIETREEDIDLYDAYTADESFVTSTSFCICPVSSINGSPVGDLNTVPGPVTSRLLDAYSGLVGIDIQGQYLSRL